MTKRKAKKMAKKMAKEEAASVELVRKLVDNRFAKEFKEFINQGNMAELAIGVAVGGAFTTIVKSLVDDIVMPIASLLAGGADFSSLAIDIPNMFGANTTAHIAYGKFVQNVVNFLAVAVVVFVVVKALNRMNATLIGDEEKNKQQQS